MSENLMDKMVDVFQHGLEVAKRNGASAAKLGFSRSENISCSFKNGKLKDTGLQQTFTYTIEVLVNGQRGIVVGSDINRLDERVIHAVMLANIGSRVHFDKYPASAETKKVLTYSARTAALTRKKMIESCQIIVDALKNYNPNLFISSNANRYVSEGLIVTSGGVCYPFYNTRWSLGSNVQRIKDTDMFSVGKSLNWGDLNEFYDPEYITKQILQDLHNSGVIVEPPKGKVTAFLHPEILNKFLMAITYLGANGKNVAKGDSPLRGRLGEQILDPSITIVDDPHLDYCSGATEIDNDGIPTRVVIIVKHGVLENFLYDFDSARLAGVEPTGNNQCIPYSLEVFPGQRKSEELLTNINDGIYIKKLIGFGQSNIINGDFSSNVALGYRIKGGKIVGRVKNTMIAGNLYELLKRNVELSSDTDPIIRMPYAVIDGLKVNAAK
jgi:PmbA protein